MGWFNQGKKDSSQNKGQQNTNSMTHQEKEKYTAGWHAGKKK